jgi:hypothetical protein
MNDKIETTKKDILHWMIEFIEDDDEPPYRKSDVEECDSMLSDFIVAVARSEEKSNFQWWSQRLKSWC